MIKTACIAGLSFLAAALGLSALYLLVALAPPVGPWTNKDQVSFLLLWGLHGWIVAGSLGVGALSSAPDTGPDGKSRPRPRVVGSELVALLLTPGLWTVAYLMVPVLTDSGIPEWQRRFTPGEELLAVPLTNDPSLSVCGLRRPSLATHPPLVGGCRRSGGRTAGVLTVWIADIAHCDTGVLIGLWVWPAATLLAGLWASRETDLKARRS